MGIVINLANSIKMYEHNEYLNPNDANKIFPKLLWILRDFSLQLVDTNGNQITMSEYLEQSLKDVKGINENVIQKNRIRKIIRDFFKDRDCYCLVRPSEDENILQNINDVDDNQLRPEFINGIKEMKKLISNNICFKVCNNINIDGRMLLSLAQSYIDSLNKGGIPTLQTAWNYMCINHSNILKLKLIDEYKQ